MLNLKLLINITYYHFLFVIIFYDKDYKPTKEEISTAVQDLVARGLNEQQASEIVDKAMSGEGFTMKFMGKAVKVSKGSYIGRYHIPESLRKVMGEVTDLDRVLPVTMSRLETIKAKYDLFANLATTPDVSYVKPKMFEEKGKRWEKIPDDKLSWGDLAGKYVSPDLYEMLNEFTMLKNKNLELITNFYKFIKMGKTTYSIGNWIQQFTGNIEPSMYAGNSILNPINAKYYSKALNLMYSKDKSFMGDSDFAKTLISKGGYDTTYIHSGDYNYMLDYVKSPTHLPELLRLAKHFNDRFVNAWASIDQLFKISTIMKYMENGMTIENAIEKMSKWYPMFSEPSRMMRRLQTEPALRVVREAVLSPFVSFRMARNVVLRNILNDPKKRWFWAAARASRWGISLLTASYFGSKLKKQWEEFKTKHPAKTATGDIMPMMIGNKLVPLEDRWDIFKLTDVFSPYDYVGGNILYETIKNFAQERTFGKADAGTSIIMALERITPQFISIPIELMRLEGKKEGQTKYMQKKIEKRQEEKAISGSTGVKPYLSEMMSIERKVKTGEINKLPRKLDIFDRIGK